jgi:hypothetical protein
MILRLRLFGAPLLSHNLKPFACRTMASVAPPAFKPFTLTLIQLGSIGSDKAANLQHAREMIAKAAKGNSDKKPQVVVLPVWDRSCFTCLCLILCCS